MFPTATHERSAVRSNGLADQQASPADDGVNVSVHPTPLGLPATGVRGIPAQIAHAGAPAGRSTEAERYSSGRAGGEGKASALFCRGCDATS